MLKVKPKYKEIDLASLTENTVEGVVYILLNPPRSTMEAIGDIGLRLEAWSKLDDKTKKVETGNKLLNSLYELWASLFSFDGVNPLTADELKQLQQDMPRYVWLILTDKAMREILSYEKKIAKKAIGMARPTEKGEQNPRPKSSSEQ